MFSDPQFWVFIAFVIFVAITFKPIKKIFTSSLDNKIKIIKNNIDQAEKIKNEAQNTLSQIKKRNKLAEIKIEQIVRDTNLQIQNYIVQNAIKTTVLLLE